MNKTEIMEEIDRVYGKAAVVFGQNFEYPKIKFTLKGKCAGQFCFKHYSDDRELNFNLPMAKLNGGAFKQTIVHEVAHHIVKVLYQYKTMPHGKEWKTIMRKLGAEPKRTHSYQLPESILKKKPFLYRCNCSEHNISNLIHKRMEKGGSYTCKKCKGKLVFIGEN